MTNDRIRLTPLTPADIGAKTRGKYVTLDSQGRLMLSAEFCREIGIFKLPARLALSYDVKSKTIGIVKQDVERVPNAYVVKTDKRGYISSGGRAVADKLALPMNMAPYKFAYIGKLDDTGVNWYAFKLAED
ncbi:MAG: hypothetical protein ACQEV7_07705 [Bacillota bacterium]